MLFKFNVHVDFLIQDRFINSVFSLKIGFSAPGELILWSVKWMKLPGVTRAYAIFIPTFLLSCFVPFWCWAVRTVSFLDTSNLSSVKLGLHTSLSRSPNLTFGFFLRNHAIVPTYNYLAVFVVHDLRENPKCAAKYNNFPVLISCQKNYELIFFLKQSDCLISQVEETLSRAKISFWIHVQENFIKILLGTHKNSFYALIF